MLVTSAIHNKVPFIIKQSRYLHILVYTHSPTLRLKSNIQHYFRTRSPEGGQDNAGGVRRNGTPETMKNRSNLRDTRGHGPARSSNHRYGAGSSSRSHLARPAPGRDVLPCVPSLHIHTPREPLGCHGQVVEKGLGLRRRTG